MLMEYKLRSGMEVDVEYECDPFDHHATEITAINWRGVDIFGALTQPEISEIYSAISENEYDRMVCAGEDLADRMRDERMGV